VGLNRFCQCAIHQPRSAQRAHAIDPAKLAQVSVKALVFGRSHSSLLTAEGHIYVWARHLRPPGLGKDGRKVIQHPTQVALLQDIPMQALACGDQHMLALTKKRHAATW